MAWSWDGTNVTPADLTVTQLWTEDGWQPDNANPTATLNGQTVPAPAIQGFGTAPFHWFAGLYEHTQEADPIVYADGNCYADFSFTGTKPGEGSYVTMTIQVQNGTGQVGQG